MKNKILKKSGFTLVEIILYVAIVALITTVITNFGLDTLKEKSLNQAKQIVEQDTNFIINKITQEIESAQKINRFASIFGANNPNGKIVLNKPDNSLVTIFLSGSSVYHQKDVDTPQTISSPEIQITKLNFLADIEDGNMPKGIQIKMHVKSSQINSTNPYEQDFQTTVVPKAADVDNDGIPDNIDQFPLDSTCTKDSDGDDICDEKDNCVLVHNTDQKDDDNDGIGTSCDDYVDVGGPDEEEGTPDENGKVTLCHYPPGNTENKHTLKVGQGAVNAHLKHGDTMGPCTIEEVSFNEDGNNKKGGMWEGVNTVDSCIYTCNQTNPLWKTICQSFECFYTGNIHKFETNEDNDEYAGVGQIYSTDTENMYWKKKFTLDYPDDLIAKIDRIEVYLNYCHSGSRLWTWWRQARCSGLGYHLNGYFVGDQNLDLFNYTTNEWDTIGKLETILTNNQKTNAIFQYSNNVQRYINGNKEVMLRVNFIANGAEWGDPQRWDFLSPTRYLLIDYLTLETHIQGTSTCGDKVIEMDEQCDDGSHCSDGTDCTGSGNTVCTGIGDGICKARTAIGSNCSNTCLNENAVCGNNLTEMGEECDDGNTSDGDGCNNLCKIEKCGNHIVESPEECDPGTRCDLSGLNCTTNLECAGIGDGLCKMRNGDDDACSSTCLNEICGNARIDYNEQCDDGNTIDGDGCNSICRFEGCGNGIKDTGEECDDGNGINADDCSNTCKIQFCGDNLLNRSIEECDDGKQCGDIEKTSCTEDANCIGIGDGKCLTRNLDSCDANCKLEFAVCGNGVIEPGEECDEGNTNDFHDDDDDDDDDDEHKDYDTCSHTCMKEYTANYDFGTPTQNGLNQNRTSWVVYSKTSALPSAGPDWNIVNNFSYGNNTEQIEFNRIDSLIPQPTDTSYAKIKTSNNTRFRLDGTTGNYFLHKFDFKVDEAEFQASETTPKRIEEIEVVWEGRPREIWDKTRTVKMYIWKNNTWVELVSYTWPKNDDTDRIFTAKITNNIGSYIDTNRKIYVLVTSDYKGQNIISTDQMKINLKAYKYRDGYE